MVETLDAGTLAHLTGSEAYESYYLVWITARDRATGAAVSGGFWTGPDPRNFTIDSVVRSYAGAGNLIDIDPVQNRTGLDVILTRVSLSHVTPEVAQMLRGYDTRLAPVEIHIADYIPQTATLAGPPRRIVLGWADSLTIPTPKIGETGVAVMKVASSARALTKKLTAKWSDETQQAEHPGDDFFKFANVSGEVKVQWGG